MVSAVSAFSMASTGTSTATATATATLPAARILVVDDSPTLRKLTCAILRQSGFQCLEADNGKLALEILKETAIDLVLLDFVMPIMNGFQFCRELRKSDPLRKTPVILVSAKSHRIRERFVEQTGALDAISKPFDANALLAVVENGLRRVREGNAPEPTPMQDSEFVEPEGSVPPGPLDSTNETTARVRVSGMLSVKLAEHLNGWMGKNQDELLAEISERITPQVSREILAATVELETGTLFSGRMRSIPLGAVFHVIQGEGLSGTLHMTKEDAEILATFREGTVDLVEARGVSDEFRLGRFLVEDGALTSIQQKARPRRAIAS
jgi:DNA-binding response OmpR family regulator